MTATAPSDYVDDGYAEWQQRHQDGSAKILADARQHLQAALGQIIAVRAELDAAQGAWRDCDGECTACIGPTAQQDIEAFIADAERMLRAAQALTRPLTD